MTHGRPPQIFAFSGMREQPGDELGNDDLLRHALALTGRDRGARVCYLPTAVGDLPRAVEVTEARIGRVHAEARFTALTLFPRPSVDDVRSHLLGQDLVLVEGGSVVNLLALWRVHGLVEPLREAWRSGVVLAGSSAGSICWHQGGPTDSFREALDPCGDALGFLPFSNGVHDDFQDQPRRDIYRRLVADKTLAPGYATEDGVGLHYIGTEMCEAVSARRSSGAWFVQPEPDGSWSETRIPTRYLG